MSHRSSLPSVVLLAIAALHAGTFYPAKPGDAVIANEYLVKLLPGASAFQISGIAPGSKVQPLQWLNIHKVTLPSGSTELDARTLAASSLVIYVEPNHIRKVVVVAPNDPNFGANQYGLSNIQAAQAWGIMPNAYLTAATAGASRVAVAVIDTGIDCTHPDFMNAGGTSTDSALGGQLSFSLGKAFVPTTVPQPKCSWQDDFGHGTHVAGIVAAATNNGTGVASLGYPLQVAGYKGLDSAGSGDDATLASAITGAADAGIRVVSASWGAAGYSQTLQDAVNYAWQRNTMFIAAAGNDHANELFFPAGATHAFGVAATDGSNAPANFSNFGNAVSIAAPGANILSTMPTYPVTMSQTPNPYQYLYGTSMATPFVSALAGLLEMANPNTSAAAILQRIQQTAMSTTANGGWDPTKGFGVINAYNALSGTLRPATTGALIGQITDGNGVPVGGATITVNAQAVTADANGLYRFAALPAGAFTVSVSGGAFAPQNLSATIAPGADTVLPVMMGVNYGKFTGTVTDAGVAVAGAIVQAITQSVNGPLISATAVTDLSGAYTLWVAGGTYDVTASSVSANSGTVTAKAVAAGGSTAVNVTIARFGMIGGAVRNGGAQLVAGAQLLITGGGLSFGAVSDSNGNYKTVGLPTGTYSIRASATGFGDAIVNNVAVAPDATTTANIQLALPAPTLASPASGATGIPATTSLNWNAVTGTSGYSVYLGTTNPPAFLQVANSTFFTPSSALNPSTTYYWKIASRDPSNGNAESPSPVWLFTTAAGAAGTNLALGKSATQSSTLGGYGPSTVASSAVDGKTDGNFFNGSVSHTNGDTNAWWQVDLGSSAAVSSITIWNRTDCCADRLSDYWVFVSNTPFSPTDTPATLQSRAGTLSSHQTAFPNPSTALPVNASGRYVRVQLSGTNYLNLAEVQVFGTASGPTTYGISGQITLSGAGQNGVTVTLSGSQSGSTATNASGNYSFAGLPSGGNYTLTPSLNGYSFAPPSQTFNNLSASQTANFIASASTTSNLALGKPATQSSTLSGFGPTSVASSAVDGNTDGNFSNGSVTHTNGDANAWWQVDLGSSATVSSIAIWNRTDCCGDRLSDYWVFVSNTPFGPTDTPATLQGRAGTWSNHQTTFPNPSTTIAVNAPGRYVRVQLSGTNYLSLAEVQVFGTSSGTITYGISGQVTLSGVAQSGVTVTLSGSQSGSTVTSTSGNYSFTGLASGGSYTVTPFLNGYSFTPPSQTFSNLSANQAANFIGTASSNLAQGKTATQSSALAGYGPTTVASSAVDGKTDGNFFNGSVSHTNADANAWWQVDLGSAATVSSLTIWNRTDCCGDRLSDYWVFVSNTPFGPTDTPATLQGRAGTWSSHQTTFPNPWTAIAVNSAGRYVRVQLSGTNYLNLAEVQVFGQ